MLNHFMSIDHTWIPFVFCNKLKTQNRTGTITATEQYNTNYGGYRVIYPHSSNSKEKHWKHLHVRTPFTLEPICTTRAVHVAHPSRSHCWYCCRCFTVLDAMEGYHQSALDQDSQLLITFITPFGRFKYVRVPYEISSISEHYNRCMAEALVNLSGCCRIIDDIVALLKIT